MSLDATDLNNIRKIVKEEIEKSQKPGSTKNNLTKKSDSKE